ncbi:HNH endonuclease signature motif containing protein [Pararhizobium mangrovi]|uniref:HNH endonuclease n=1 Tax=Pararhizobium mangrovi TaxID=2590452 RepID=A0A506U8X2_9HYPH|nr:HNH endonuclease signature motif containing protein [Pararhizobium mangrovi]TPW29968.1 HNH endonuclease [Pararhizobium mangrovi]
MVEIGNLSVTDEYCEKIEATVDNLSERLGLNPENFLIQFGNGGDPNIWENVPNYQLIFGPYCFVFNGQNHKPYLGKLNNEKSAYEEGYFREGQFLPENLISENESIKSFSIDELMDKSRSRDEKVRNIEINRFIEYINELKFSTDSSRYDDVCTSNVRAIENARRKRRDRRFRADVLARGGGCCVCGCMVRQCLEAAHIVAVSCDGSDNVNNGLVLCANHHRMFDKNLFSISATDFTIKSESTSGLSLFKMGITEKSASLNRDVSCNLAKRNKIWRGQDAKIR